MHNRKLFPPLPPWAKDHPQALEWRVERLETTLEDQAASPLSNSALQPLLGYILALILWLCGLLGLVSPETAAQLLIAIGH